MYPHANVRQRAVYRVAIVVILGAMSGTIGAASIPENQIDRQKIFWGSPANFQKPGEVSIEEIVKATPEYNEIRKDKIEPGTGKYWILMSQASDRAVRAIAEVGQEAQYDLITAAGYLGGLNPPIAAEDITKIVVEKMTGSDKKKSEEKK